MTDEPASLERKIELLEAELRQARRMAALGELVSTTTHEFNNVLTTIINYAKLGLRHKDEASRDKAFTKILTAAGRAEKITNGVLGMARNRGHERIPTDLAKLIESSLVLLEREMQKYRIQIVTQFEPAPLAFVCGNEIQQVLLNLLTNARQAMSRGGQILIRIAPDSANNTVDLTVRDNGSGIPPEVLPRIFDRYFTTKAGARRKRQRRHRRRPGDVPRNHRIASGQDPRRKHRRRRHGFHAQAASRKGRSRAPCAATAAWHSNSRVPAHSQANRCDHSANIDRGTVTPFSRA